MMSRAVNMDETSGAEKLGVTVSTNPTSDRKEGFDTLNIVEALGALNQANASQQNSENMSGPPVGRSIAAEHEAVHVTTYSSSRLRMNKDKEGKESKESTPRNEQDDKSGRQLKSLSQSEGLESWSTAESSVGSSARRRPSSWDDSDDDAPSAIINSFNHNGLIYLGESQRQEVAEEKNDKKSKLDTSDRRKSPARIRRRTKSSSSSSAVLEPTVECSSSEYKDNFQILTPESYQYKAPRYQSYSSRNPSLKTGLESDSNYFLDHIFTELRTNMTGLVSLGEDSSIGHESRGGKVLDLESCSGSNVELLRSHDLARTLTSPTYNPAVETLKRFESQEPMAFIHKTSKKLSQILEVEETKKSQEGINLSEEEEEEEGGDVQLFEMSPFLWTNPQKPPDDVVSPFPTSNDGEKNELCWTSVIPLRNKAQSPTLETVRLSPKNTGSWEKLRDKEKPENKTRKEVLERFHNLFPDSDSENIIFLTEKRGKTQLGSNAERLEGNDCSSLKDYEKVKQLDEIEREREDVNSDSGKVDFGGENPEWREESTDSAVQQKNLRHVKTLRSELGQNSHEETIPNLSEQTILSWSEGSTPRRSSRHSSRKSSKHEREPDFKLGSSVESSNIQPQKLTSRSLKEGAFVNSSRESSSLPKDDYTKSKSGETSKGSSRRTFDNAHTETADDQPNCLNIDLGKVCSDSNTSTESDDSSSRTITHEEIQDFSFRTNSSDQSAISSTKPATNRSSKKMNYHLSDSSHHKRPRTEGSKTDRHSKSQKMSSRSLRDPEVVFRKLERNTGHSVSCGLSIRERQTSGKSESRTTAAGKTKSSETDETGLLSRKNSSDVSEVTGFRLARLKDSIEKQESTTILRQIGNDTVYDDVKSTAGNVISEKLNSSRSDKTGAKCKNNKSSGRNEETMEAEDVSRNLFPMQTKDDIQEESKSCETADGGTVRNTVSSEQFSEGVMAVEESKKCLGEKSSPSRSCAKSAGKEPTIPIYDISYSLGKIEIDLVESGRERERAKAEGNQEVDTSRRTGRLSIACEISEESTEALKVKPLSGETSNRSCGYTETEGSPVLNEKLKSTNGRTSFRGHETSRKSMASKPVFQDQFNGETWNRLIDAFDGTQKSDYSLDNKFPGFPSLNQKEFTEHDREETQEFFLYEPVPESISCPLEHSEERILFKSDQEKSVEKHDSKRRNFQIGEFGDGNCWHDGKPDISEPDKPQYHGDGDREKRSNLKTFVLRLEDSKEETKMKIRRHTWMELEGKAPQPNPTKNKSLSGKENNADLGLNLIAHSLNHSKSENSLLKMRSQQRTNESDNLITPTNTGPMKGSTKRESNKDSLDRTGDCSEESSYEEREHQVGRLSSSDESQLPYADNPRKNFERLGTVTSEIENRKQEKESMNLNIFLAGRKKETALVRPDNWLIIKNQGGKESKQQKEKIRKLKKKLKKCEKWKSAKEPFYNDENATGKMPAFVPTLKFGDTGCLQNFYKRLISICCLTSDSSAATSV